MYEYYVRIPRDSSFRVSGFAPDLAMIESEIRKDYQGIIDSTLREGRQFRWGEFTVPQQIRIVESLRDIGVERIEVGNPIQPQIRKEITSLTEIEKRPPFLAHVRARVEDVRAAIEAGVEGINLLTTVNERRLNKLRSGQGITLEEHIREMQQCIRLAQASGMETRVSVEHFFNSSFADAMRVYQVADNLGVNRIGLADTIGLVYPWEVAELVADVREKVNAAIEVHFHNDQGHAVGNALVALRTGANWVDTTAAGIGERTGITPLSTLLVNLLNIDPELVRHYKLDLLTFFENFVMEFTEQNKDATGIAHGGIPFNLPTNRQNGFAHKGGIHVNAILTLGPEQYELYPPKLIGNTQQIVIGTPISGRTTREDIKNFQALRK